MNSRRYFPAFFVVVALPLGAQAPAPVTMPVGSYVIQARDTSVKAERVMMAGWPFVLKGNGDFSITTPDSMLWTGRLVQKDGLATYTDQGCSEPGVYVLRMEANGYVFDAKSETCTVGVAKLRFVPGKPKK
jgi:hypothetical protein